MNHDELKPVMIRLPKPAWLVLRRHCLDQETTVQAVVGPLVLDLVERLSAVGAGVQTASRPGPPSSSETGETNEES
ncbi:MAG: hypothetical protein IMY86_13845 [Chloroflexi bacterium]|nr:hypothetical protein [Chloroflexota bacterium]